MTEHADGSGNFTEVVLRPRVTIAAGSDAGLAQRLHDAVDELCFIARSVKFPGPAPAEYGSDRLS